MTGGTDKIPGKSGGGRKKRLAAALRENLRRRKAQARGRSSSTPGARESRPLEGGNREGTGPAGEGKEDNLTSRILGFALGRPTGDNKPVSHRKDTRWAGAEWIVFAS